MMQIEYLSIHIIIDLDKLPTRGEVPTLFGSVLETSIPIMWHAIQLS